MSCNNGDYEFTEAVDMFQKKVHQNLLVYRHF